MVVSFSVERWAVLTEAEQALIDKSKTQGTWKNIDQHVESYIDFCDGFDKDAFPVRSDVLCKFITSLFLDGCKYSTIKNYLSSISTAMQLREFEPLEYPLRVRLTLEGICRFTEQMSERAHPITALMLKRMSIHVDPRDEEQLVAWGAIVVGFHLMLRKSNLVPDSGREFDPSHQFTRISLREHRDSLIAHLSWSKTNQVGRPVYLPLVPNHTMACPVMIVKLIWQTIDAPDQAPLFSFHSKMHGGLIPLTYRDLQFWLKHWVGMIGTSPARYSCHSLCRGGASFAFTNNISADNIKLLGEWQSDSYQVYLDTSMIDRFKTARRLASVF